MDKNGLLSLIHSLEDPTKVRFYEGGDQVSSRFDLEEGPKEEGTSDRLISFYLYSLIANAIILKAQGKEKSKEGEEAFRTYFSDVVRRGPIDDLPKMEDEKGNALRTLDSFLFDLEKIDLSILLARFSPLVVIDVADDGKHGLDKDVLRSFDKNREVIFNQSVLFIRSIFHSFLTLPTTDSFRIRPDSEDLTNGIFLYEDSLFIPTGKNAFTLSGFKEVASYGLETVSKNLPLENLKTITVVYLCKDLLAEIDIA
jgi:hypothetical protein